MKKLVTLSLLVLLMSTAVSAQIRSDRFRRQRITHGFSNGQITRPERLELRKDQFRYRIAERKAHRDGRVTPLERRRLQAIKRDNRRELFRFKHNNRRRII
jgi:hypothetical protein